MTVLPRRKIATRALVHLEHLHRAVVEGTAEGEVVDLIAHDTNTAGQGPLPRQGPGTPIQISGYVWLGKLWSSGDCTFCRERSRIGWGWYDLVF